MLLFSYVTDFIPWLPQKLAGLSWWNIFFFLFWSLRFGYTHHRRLFRLSDRKFPDGFQDWLLHFGVPGQQNRNIIFDLLLESNLEYMCTCFHQEALQCTLRPPVTTTHLLFIIGYVKKIANYTGKRLLFSPWLFLHYYLTSVVFFLPSLSLWSTNLKWCRWGNWNKNTKS